MKYALAGVAAVLLAALTLLVSRLTAEPPAAPVDSALTAQRPSAAATRFFSELGNTDPGPQIDIALTDDQALIADSALRGVMDYYLLGRTDAGRLQALRDHLQRRLPPAAAREATQLAQHYADYLRQHDELLAAQNFQPTPDAGRLQGWQQQRHQLRLRALGPRVTEEWFGTEEAYLSQALIELRQPPQGEAPDEDEARHRLHMRQVLAEARQPLYPPRAN